MKYLPLIALTVAISACAAPPMDHYTSIGTSPKPPRAVAQCIATSWADKTQQPVVSQTTIANDMGLDVMMPGQAPAGTAAIVRPSTDGRGGSWVGFRATNAMAPDAMVASDLRACL